MLWEDVRAAKEILSRSPSTSMYLPLFETDVPLGREQLEQLAAPVLDRTVNAVRAAIREARLPSGQISGLFLVGGSSRIPLVSTLLHRAFGVAPIAIEQPELVVAEGSLHAPPQAPILQAPPPAGPARPVPAAPATPMSPSPTPPIPVRQSQREPEPLTEPPTEPQTAGLHQPEEPTDPPTGPQVEPLTEPHTEPQTPYSITPTSGLHQPGPAYPVSPGPISAAPVSPAAVAAHQRPVPPRKTGYADAPHGGAPAPLVPSKKPSKARIVVPVAAAVVVLAVLVGVVLFVNRDRKSAGSAGRAGSGGAGVGNAAAATFGPPVCGKSIGFMGALTGSLAALGSPMRDAARLAVDQYNTLHPTCTVSLVQIDSQGTADRVPAAVQGIDDDVLGLIGPTLSSETTAAGPLLEAAKLPFVTPSATADALSRQSWSTFHRSIGNETQEANAATRYLTQRLKTPKVYVVADADSYGQAMLTAVTHARGVQIVGQTTLAASTDYAQLVTTISRGSADAVLFASYLDEGVKLLKPLRQAGFDGTFLSGDRGLDQQFAAQVPDTSGSSYVLCGCRQVDGSGAAGARFSDEFSQAFNTSPSDYAGIAYDTAGLLLAGLARGADTRARMAQHLASTDYAGVTGAYRFTSTGDLTTPKFGVYRFAEGQLIFDETI